MAYNFSLSLQENHFAGYNASGDVPDTVTNDRPLISPPQNVILQRSPSQDYTLMTAMFAPLDVDERVLTEDVYTYVKRDNLCHSLTFVSQTQTTSLDDEDTGFTPSLQRITLPLPPSSTFHIQLRTSMRKIIIELHGWAPAFNTMSHNAVDIHSIQSRISFKIACNF
ncbi:hypothetical protein EV424DRAFT_1433527, partial [Suillus variegatus]